MKLNLAELGNGAEFEKAGVELPTFDVAAMQEEGKANPRWIHLGPGNIFRIFPARVAHDLLADGQHWPVTAVVPMNPEELDAQLGKHDLMTLGVTLNPDGTRDLKVIAGISEGLAWQRPADFARLAQIVTNPDVTLMTMTITEKGYGIHDSHGELSEQVQADIAANPRDFHANTMANIAGLLVRRYDAGGAPINVISFDNFSHNGDKLRDSVLTIMRGWAAAGSINDAVLAWVTDDTKVAFPITVIDKITPRPNESVADALKVLGFTDMGVEMLGRTPVAGFVNAEPTEYLIIEDKLVGEVPDFSKYGVNVTSRQVCDDFENMKVTTCLNPLHTALATVGVVLRLPTIDAEMRDPALKALVERLGWKEGLPVVVDPGIVSPEDFLREVLEVRFPNRFLPDDPARIAMDTSQKVGIRFGQTIKKYIDQGRDLSELRAIALVIANWMRYLLAVDDDGAPFEPASDPLLAELQAHLDGVVLGQSVDAHAALEPILSNPAIFGVNLYDTPIAERVEALFTQLVAGPGAVRSTLDKEMLS
ncbi:mannitol dehydrogenase family protein [Trueperella pecoris]|uniref:mannitol dehydrogenase family protein n=1 Tax=Trueperella pecoris TaxID=2733571 RepID=UPI00186BA674|nr:mannitol dehydrogenase family protein [Trueperella pecoris]QOQ39652.1 mannitol dehydrogenase family protein [Trueperella pecoris]QTG75561.1 mannitol dehydrogenase family protein [Trueperella pecoris]